MEPERIVTTRNVFDGKIVQLRVDTVLLPTGRQVEREVVEHDAVAVIVPVDQDDNVVLVRQYRHPIGQDLLEIPAGIVEGGESPEDCARRELQEETGYAAGTLRALGGFWTSPGFCTEFVYAYHATDLSPSRLAADEDEFIQVEKLPLTRVGGLIQEGEIQDAKTIAALLMLTCVFDRS